MFCPKCGKENSNGSIFCSGCGERFGSGDMANTPNMRRGPLMETISFTEKPEREQTTIDMHQKMGWVLKSSQEINTSSTSVYGNSVNGNGYVSSVTTKEHYVKLVFERDKNMPNYSILKEKYDRFTALAQKIAELEASIKKRTPKFYLVAGSPVFLSFLISIIKSGKVGFLFLFPMLLLHVALLIPIYLLADKLVQGRVRAKVAPQVAELYHQMSVTADEAEKYL